MIGRLGAAMLLATTVGATAQTVTVRSGDHASFARLVFEFASGRPEWRLDREGGGYVLTFDAPDLRLDTSDVFRLIGRDRVESVVQDGPGGPLRIGLSCDCHAEGFEYRTSVLVIDIRDGPAPGVSEPGTPPASDPGPDWAQSANRPLPVPGSPVPGAVLPFSWELETGMDRTSPRTVTDFDPGDAENAPGASARDAVAVEAIAERLARASSQGLVELAPGSIAQGAARADAAEPPDATVGRPAVGGNIRVMTDIDQSFGTLGPDRHVDRAEPACLPDRLVSIDSWGDEYLLGGELADFRAAILDAGDRPDAQAIRNLARHYVFLTFGAEARTLLDVFPDDTLDTDVLRALADVMDDHPTRPDGPLAGQASCASPVALWALLAAPDAAAEKPATAAIVTTFSRLPLHLRRHLAPRLAAALDAAGQPDAAGIVLSSVTRAPGRHGAAVALAAATRDPDGLAGDAALRSLLAADPEDAAAAALALLELELSDGGPVDPEVLEDAAALAFELRDLPIGRALAKVRILGLAENGQIGAALADLTTLAARGDARDEVQALAADLFGRADEVGDVDLLSLAAVVGRVGVPGEIPADARIDAAARLIDLGAAEFAEPFLFPPDEADPRLRLARARHDLSLGRASDALARVEGLDGEGVALIRGEALMSLGDYRAAADAFARPGNEDQGEVEPPFARDGPPTGSEESRAPLTLLGEAEDLRLQLEALLVREGR